MIDDILKDFKSGKISLSAAKRKIGNLSFVDMGFAKIDSNRKKRTGAAEVVYGRRKTPMQIVKIMRQIISSEKRVLATRISEEAAQLIKDTFPDADINEAARTAVVDRRRNKPSPKGDVAIVTAGTADIPVAEEARRCAEFFGCRTKTYFDCGVAGLQRLVSNAESIGKARVAIAVAGMEGALPSVLAGLIKIPVIAVPTSVGYGANFGGLATLLAMLNSCANGVSVVNIDNGFGAAYSAWLIVKA